MLHPISETAMDQIAADVPADTPILMLNLLRFHADGGREGFFGAYVAAFRDVVAAHDIDGVRPIWSGDGVGLVAGPDDEMWDAIVIVRYPSIAAFRSIVDSEQYRHDAAPHRLAALTDWRLVAHVETPIPD